MRTIRIVNVIPNDHSNETNNDAEPSVTVNPSNIDEMIVTAFTPTEGGNANGPLFFSSDGGENWIMSFEIPGGETHDQSPLYGGTSDQLFMGTLRGDTGDLNVLRAADPSAGTADVIESRSPVDQPWVEAIAVHGGSDDGQVRLYVGYNRNVSGKSAAVDVCLDARTGSPSFNRITLDPRNPAPNDGYEIRPTAHSDGTVYVAYKSRSSFSGQQSVTDIVVARDDDWASGGSPFTDLKDPDGNAGRLVATNVPINEVNDLGGIRLNNDLNIAVDPTNSNVVYLVWCDDAGPNYTLRVRRSINRGQDWSEDLLTAESAALATMTINRRGMVGLLYQQLVGGRMETHFRTTVNGTNWDDTILARTDPSPSFTGDYARLVAVGLDFYGVFPAMNSPAAGNFFPNGGGTVRFLRNTSGGALVGTDGVTIIAQSVDPFFFKVQQRDCVLITDRNTFSKDEIDAILHQGAPAVIPAAFYVTVDGFRASDLNITAGTLTGTPNVAPSITFAPGLGGMTTQATACAAEDPDHLELPQRFTWTFQASFTNTNDFTAENRPEVLTASITSTTGLAVSGQAVITLTTQPNPYEVDGPTSWLSVDVQVFTLLAGTALANTPGIVLGTDPNAFITQLLSNTGGGYNDPALARAPNHPYDLDLVAKQDSSTVSLARTNFFIPIFNFAVARVRYRALSTPAPNVRAFFRMFQVSTTSTEFQPTTTYLTGGQGGTKIPLLGVVNNEVVTIPFFAAPRVDPTNPAGLNSQTDPVNVGPNAQAIPPDGSGAEVQVYFGCWLDINQPTHVLPGGGQNGSTPYVATRSIQEVVRGQHQCIVAEINLDPPSPQIAAGIAPANSDKLAQRNLTIVGVASPHQVPVTFDIKPTAATLGAGETPDELLIDWGSLPTGTKASVFLPGTSADAILETASRLYLAHGLTRVDGQTIGCRARGLTFVPIPPGIGSNFAGLLTLDLPPSVPRDRTFKVVTKQLRTVRAKRPAPIPVLGSVEIHAAAIGNTDLIEWRRVVGAFQINVPVSTRAQLLPVEERLLSVLRWIASRMSLTDRWYPVFQRYLQLVAGRVDDLGGDSSTIEPSPSGEPDRPTPHGERCITGKVVGIVFDHFGDFEGFVVESKDGEHRFHSREQHVEQLVERAWRERLRVEVCASPRSSHSVEKIIILEPPVPFGH